MLFALFIIFPSAYAQQGHMTLLAVADLESGEQVGGIADLFLEVKLSLLFLFSSALRSAA